MIHDVWYNCIFEENDPETNEYTRPNGYYLDDFNDALANLFSDETFFTAAEQHKKRSGDGYRSDAQDE